MELFDPAQKRKTTLTLPRRRKIPDLLGSLSGKQSRKSRSERNLNSELHSTGSTVADHSARTSRVTFDEPDNLRGRVAPPAYGDETSSSLALPITRLSDSSKSDGSFGDHHGVYATTTTTHTVSTTTTFFRLSRRKKQRRSLFPVPIKVQPLDSPGSVKPTFPPCDPSSGRPSESPGRNSPSDTPPIAATRPPNQAGLGDHELNLRPSLSQTALPASSTLVALPGMPDPPQDSSASAQSGRSSPVFPPPTRFGLRGRSSTKGSFGPIAGDESLPTPPLPHSTRTSTSTTGRGSLGGILGLSRLRNNSEPLQARHGTSHIGIPGTPCSNGSKPHSLNLNREAPLVVPERQEGDTPAKYLIRLEEAVSRGVVASILSKSTDEFSKNVLRSYMRGFSFFGYPLDMSIRKLLMEVELPKETQQIDRVLQAFANRYHECNPGIYISPGMRHRRTLICRSLTVSM